MRRSTIVVLCDGGRPRRSSDIPYEVRAARRSARVPVDDPADGFHGRWLVRWRQLLDLAIVVGRVIADDLDHHHIWHQDCDRGSVNYNYGVLSVSVTVSGRRSPMSQIASLDDGGNFRSQSIDQQSIPTLEQQALQAQSANIQGVSGASYTVKGSKNRYSPH